MACDAAPCGRLRAAWHVWSAPLQEGHGLPAAQDEEYAGFGGPHCMVHEGYGAITDALAASLDLRLSCPVVRIEDDDSGVRVVTAAGGAALGTELRRPPNLPLEAA